MLETLLLLSFVFLLLASLHDLKTREVPDYLSYIFILTGVIVQLYYVIKTQDYQHGVFVLLNGAGASVFSVLMYKAKQWGGADAKLTIALSINLVNPGNAWLFIQYFVHFLLVGAVYGVAGSLLLILKNWKKFRKIFEKDFKKTKPYYTTALAILILGVPLTLINGFVGVTISGVGVLALLSLLLNNANKLMIKNVPVNRLTEGDWVVEKVMVHGKVLFDPDKEVDVKQKQINLMKKGGIKKVRIIEGIPFIPSFLIAFLITMISPELFLNLIKGLAF
jgi:Flp pilus assembly protein protease CpaA